MKKLWILFALVCIFIGNPGFSNDNEPDFGPYMREMQRRIKLNWEPPKSKDSSTVVLLYEIDKKGKLLNAKVLKSSGDKKLDTSAMKALRVSAPFRPLPAEFKENSVKVQFTFDYKLKD